MINNKGEVSMLAILISLILLTITIALYFSVRKVEHTIIHRTQSYLCLKELTAHYQGLKKSYIRSNQKIRALNLKIAASVKLPPVHASLKKLKKLIIYRSDLWLTEYRRSILNLRNCNKLTKLKNLNTSPVRIKILLPRRNIFDLVVLNNSSKIHIIARDFNLLATLKDNKWIISEISKGSKFSKQVFGLSSLVASSL